MGFQCIRTILLISFIWTWGLCYLGGVLFGSEQLSLPVVAGIILWNEAGVGGGHVNFAFRFLHTIMWLLAVQWSHFSFPWRGLGFGGWITLKRNQI